MAVSFTPINNCGQQQPFAECKGVDLSRNLDQSSMENIRLGLLEHGLLVFRNQPDLSPAQQVRFNQSFGWHDPGQEEFLFGFGAPTREHAISGGAQVPDWPQVSVLGNVFLEDHHGIRNVQLKPILGFTFSAWHADGLHDMHAGMPELTTMFNPNGWQTRGGGRTYFTSGVMAMERMEPDIAEELRQCTAAYMRAPNDDHPDESRRVTYGPSYMADHGTRRIGFGLDPDDPTAGMRDFTLLPEHANGGGRHPVVRTHPDTGQESLYVTPGKVVMLLDSQSGEIRHGIEATADLLSRALLPSALPDVRYEHDWREGDFVAWLNTLVLHSASDPMDIDGPRLMHRVRLSTPKTTF